VNVACRIVTGIEGGDVAARRSKKRMRVPSLPGKEAAEFGG